MTRRSRKQRTPWVKLAAALTFMALLVGGGLTRTFEWGADQLVGVIAPDESSDPAPVPKQKQKKVPERKKDRASKNATRGQN